MISTLPSQAYTANTTAVKSEVAIAIVVVMVTDVNDNAPTFLSSHYSSSVTEDTQPGNIVLSTITAFDLDEVKGRISFYYFNYN